MYTDHSADIKFNSTFYSTASCGREYKMSLHTFFFHRIVNNDNYVTHHASRLPLFVSEGDAGKVWRTYIQSEIMHCALQREHCIVLNESFIVVLFVCASTWRVYLLHIDKLVCYFFQCLLLLWIFGLKSNKIFTLFIIYLRFFTLHSYTCCKWYRPIRTTGLQAVLTIKDPEQAWEVTSCFQLSFPGTWNKPLTWRLYFT